MKIRKIKNQLLAISKEKTNINIFYKGNYKYTISIIENQNILIVTKEDIKSEFFEQVYYEIAD